MAVAALSCVDMPPDPIPGATFRRVCVEEPAQAAAREEYRSLGMTP